VLWNDLLTAGLVDELHLMIGSAFLGDGVPVFSGPRSGLRLMDGRRLGVSQLILARYTANDTAPIG
jgi:riboflavin biosynthesis pyrimidine reductase